MTTSVSTFNNDEDGYREWCENNPNGHVINWYKPRNEPWKLHRADCPTLKWPGNQTKNVYFKVCSNNIDALTAFSSDQQFACKHCKPLS